MQLASIMSTDVEGIDVGESAATARELMKKLRIRHLVVRDGKRIAGVVSQSDLGGARGAAPQGDVEEFMNPHAVTATPSTTLREAANLLRGHVIGCLPVTENGRLVGIVTISDVLDVLGRGDTHLRDRARPYLSKRQGPSRKVRGAQRGR